VEREKEIYKQVKSFLPLRSKLMRPIRKVLKRSKWETGCLAMINAWYGDPILRAIELETVYPENFSAVLCCRGSCGILPESSRCRWLPFTSLWLCKKLFWICFEDD